LQGVSVEMNRTTRTTSFEIILAWLLFATGLMSAPAMPLQAAVEPKPVAVLREMNDHIQDVVRRDTSILEDPVRLRQLADEAVLPHVDFVALSRWVLGRYWRKATPAQREAFMTEFQEMLLLNYLGRVTTYRETAVRFLPLRAGPQDDRVAVQAEVEPAGAPVVEVLFRMHRVGERWLIYDVAVAGVSLVATHRSGFSREISQHGIDGLISRLAEHNRDGAAGTVSDGICKGCLN